MDSRHATPVPIGARRFWLCALLAAGGGLPRRRHVIIGLDLDRRIARAWFFDPDSQGWIGAGTLVGERPDSSAAGRALVWTIGLAVLAVLVGG